MTQGVAIFIKWIPGSSVTENKRFIKGSSIDPVYVVNWSSEESIKSDQGEHFGTPPDYSRVLKNS